jgi:hypothetical protein
MSRRVALVRIDVSEELRAYFIRVTKIGELGTTLPVTSNRHTLCSVYKIEINDRRGSAALTTQHPSIHESWQ